MKTLLVLTDFSAASDRALAQAERLARSSGAEVHLFHKVIYPPPHPNDLDRLDDAAKLDYVLKEVLERPEREAREALEERVSRLRDRGLAVRTHLERSGDVYERAEAAIDSVKPDLVVMGTHGRSGVRKWLMGSVAEKVLRHCGVDVLTLHEDSPVAAADDGLGEVIVATDFSECSRRALEAACRLTSSIGGSLALLHVLERRFFPRVGEGTPARVEIGDDVRRESEKALQNELAGREGSIVLAEGHVAEEIDRTARERGASMVVLGTHGASGIRHALIGSVAEKVTRFCRLPVLTVR